MNTDSNLRPLISAAHRLCLVVRVPSDVDECHHGNTSRMSTCRCSVDQLFFSASLNFIDINPWTSPLNLDRRNNVDVFHFRPVGLNVLPVLSSSYLECQSSVVYFWTSLWILLEADVLETGSWTLFSSGWSVSLTRNAALQRVLRLCPRSQGAAGEKWNF